MTLSLRRTGSRCLVGEEEDQERPQSAMNVRPRPQRDRDHQQGQDDPLGLDRDPAPQHHSKISAR